jgi:hypothetical protein
LLQQLKRGDGGVVVEERMAFWRLVQFG